MIENFSSEFFAFCRSKPAGEAYNPSSVNMCALGQFASVEGYKGGSTYCYQVNAETGKLTSRISYPGDIRLLSVHGAIDFKELPIGGYEDSDPIFTFGALVQRLEAAGVQ